MSKINLIGIASDSKGGGKNYVGLIIQALIAEKLGNIKKDFNFESFELTDILDSDILNNLWLEENSNWQIKSFAHKLKEIVSILTGIPVEDLEKEEIKNTDLNEEWDIEVSPEDDIAQKGFTIKALSYREALQHIGTDLLRNQFHKDVWINALFANYRPLRYGVISEYNTYPNWIITDVRFPNEVEAIKSRGGIIIKKESNPNIERIDKHESETALDNYKDWDYILPWQDKVEDLIEDVKKMLIHFKII